MRLAVRVGFLWAGCLTGCFYVDPLNDPPVIRSTCTFPDTGRACDGDASVHRGERIGLHMTVDDPDDNQDPVTHRWAAFTCPDDTAIAGCAPLAVGGLQSGVSTLELPASLVDVHSIFIDFRASDLLGATDSDAMVFLVNDAPSLELGTSTGSFVVGAPIALFATYGDLDAGPGDVTLRWEIVSPDARPAVLADLGVVPGDLDPAHTTVGKTFVPDSGGNWLLTVTATDSFDESHEEQLSIPVGPEPASRPRSTVAPSTSAPVQRNVASWR